MILDLTIFFAATLTCFAVVFAVVMAAERIAGPIPDCILPPPPRSPRTAR